MSLCLIAIFKNESHILKEWITHYLNQGVEKFFLIDNGSTDNYFSIIKPFIKKNFIYLVRDIKPHSQIELYNKYFVNLCKKYKWAILCDLDEFIYAKNGFNKISEYLQDINNYRNISLIFIPWKVFGSNGYNTLDKLQPESVIKSFTKRLNYDIYRPFKELFIKKNNHIFTYTKCIIKTNYLLKININEHKMLPEFNNYYNFITTYNNINNIHIHKNRAFSKINENIISSSILNLNHYCIQSLDFYSRVKMIRNDADKNDKTLKLFNKYDNNCNEIDDYELSEISNNYMNYDL